MKPENKLVCLLLICILSVFLLFLWISNHIQATKPKRKFRVEKEPISFDFEDFFPQDRRFAYVWYAHKKPDFCAALASFYRLKKLRQFETNQNVDYVLTYKEELQSKDGDDWKVTDEKTKKILFEWISSGGLLGTVKIADESMEADIRIQLKYSALHYAYDWIVLMEPQGIPLRSMDELFDLYDSAGLKSRLSGLRKPSAGDGFLLGMPEAANLVQKSANKAFGQPFCPRKMGNTALISLQSTQEVLRTFNQTFIKFQNYHIMDLPDFVPINKVLCNESSEEALFLLPSSLCLDDFQLLTKEAEKAKKASVAEAFEKQQEAAASPAFLYFSMNVKPLEKSYRSLILPKLPLYAQKVIKSWISEAKGFCHNKK